jgi:KDO2-lipid IV(A) lauroyltransferase
MAAEQGRGISDWLVDRAIRTLISALRLLPYGRRIAAMGWVTAHIAAPLAGWDRRIRENLAHVLPELPADEVRRLVRAVPDNAGRTLMEIYSGAEFAARMRQVEVPDGPGLAALRAALAQKRPVLLVTGHFGNYDAPRAWLIGQGFPVGGLYNPMSNAFFNDHYVEAISSIGRPMFQRGRAGLGEMVRFLRAGGMVGIVIDQYMGHGVALDFLGKPAPTALSAAEMALKYRALLVPIYGVRRPDGLSFEIRIEPPLEGDDPVALTQALNDSLSAIVREHLGQWFWIHRRWKPARQARRAAEAARANNSTR